MVDIDDYGIDRDKYMDDIHYRHGYFFYNYRLVAEKILGKSYATLFRWYKWFQQLTKEEKEEYRLPPMYKIYPGTGEIKNSNSNIYLNCIRYEDIPLILEFSKRVRCGLMAQYNRDKSWGKRGEEIRRKLGSKKRQSKSK